MLRLLVGLGLLLVGNSIACADADDDTLKFYLSKSDTVVMGTILSEPMGVSDEAGVLNYYCEFRVNDVIKGDSKLAKQKIRVNIVRFEFDADDHHPLIKNNAKCILLLKNSRARSQPNYKTADFWFGIQQPSPWMAKSMKRLQQNR